MPISGDIYPNTQENVDRSPIATGAYALYDGDITIYIGCGDSENGIRSRLQAHKRGDNGNCTQSATHYRHEVTAYPITFDKTAVES
jgi:hypothetical protein